MKTVVVTGFGPFLEHKVNSSWEAVKLLPELDNEEFVNIHFVTQEIPVSYESVNSIIPKLWETHKPDLVVHVGVSSKATTIVMESSASKTGYYECDVDDKQIENGHCVLGIEENIKTEFDLEKIVSDAKRHSLEVDISHNAHKYLCEYIYYVSLSINKQRTAFLHVPVLSEKYTAKDLANGINIIIRLLLKQLEDIHCRSNENEIIEQGDDDGKEDKRTDNKFNRWYYVMLPLIIIVTNLLIIQLCGYSA